MTRLKQAGVVLLGLAVGAVMLGLGLWQLDVYGAQGSQVAVDRAAEPAVALQQVARPSGPVTDGYGRTVVATGRYDPTLQVLIPVPGQPGQARVLTGLRLSGGVLPVIRGVVQTNQPVPGPPAGSVEQRGVLLASELPPSGPPGSEPAPTAPDQLSSVQLAVLAQRWSEPLVNGFITLDTAAAEAQNLRPAAVALPQGQGRSRNAAYALQWWVFAAFAVGMATKMARDIGRRDDYDALLPSADSQPGSDPGT